MALLFVEKLFFKRRNIYSCKINSEIESKQQFDLIPGFKFCIAENWNQLEAELTYSNLNKAFGIVKTSEVRHRLKNNDFVFFYLLDKETKKTAASYWAFCPSESKKWFDTFLVKKGDALLCNAYVEKQYRRKGFYSYLIRSSHQWLFEKKNVQRVFTIVEQSNRASDSVNRKYYEEVTFTNHLYKLFSFNLFSVLKNQYSKKIFFVPFGLKLYEK